MRITSASLISLIWEAELTLLIWGFCLLILKHRYNPEKVSTSVYQWRLGNFHWIPLSTQLLCIVYRSYIVLRHWKWWQQCSTAHAFKVSVLCARAGRPVLRRTWSPSVELCEAAPDSPSCKIFTYIMDGNYENTFDEGSYAVVGRPSSIAVERASHKANYLN